MTFGSPYDAAVVAEIKRELGVDLGYEVSSGDYFDAARRAIRPRSGRWAGSPTTRARTTSSGILLGDRARRTTTAAGASADFDQAIADGARDDRPGRDPRGVRPGRRRSSATRRR